MVATSFNQTLINCSLFFGTKIKIEDNLNAKHDEISFLE